VIACGTGSADNLLRSDMLRQFLLGGGVSAINIAIHALVMTVVVRVAQIASAKKRPYPSLFLTAVMIPIVSVLMGTHALEVVVWSWAYSIVDAAPAGANLVYFAFVNYTTLGYGDVTPVERWQLLGPMTAMNGVLLFGWSTAVMFEVLRRTMERHAMPCSTRNRRGRADVATASARATARP
jgi:ion channel